MCVYIWYKNKVQSNTYHIDNTINTLQRSRMERIAQQYCSQTFQTSVLICWLYLHNVNSNFIFDKFKIITLLIVFKSYKVPERYTNPFKMHHCRTWQFHQPFWYFLFQYYYFPPPLHKNRLKTISWHEKKHYFPSW